MASTTTLPAFLEAFRDALEAQPSLSGVNVFTAAVDEVSMGERSIVLAAESVQASYEYQTMPRTEVYESYEVSGIIWAAEAGGGEEAIEAARDKAFAILEGVHDQTDTVIVHRLDIASLFLDLLQPGFHLANHAWIVFLARVIVGQFPVE